MKQMGKYCKAYLVKSLREFSNWSENVQNLRKEKRDMDGNEITDVRQLTDSDHLYVQENFTVTDGVFLDENVIFDDVSPEWIDFCTTTLKFEVPVYESANVSNAAKVS